jgi:hypothetical protein
MNVISEISFETNETKIFGIGCGEGIFWQEFTHCTNPRINCVQTHIGNWKNVYLWNEKHVKVCFTEHSKKREKLEVPIKKFEAYQPIFYLKKSNKMKKVLFLSVDCRVWHKLFFHFNFLLNIKKLKVPVNWVQKVILLKNRSWLCTMTKRKKGLRNNHFHARLMLSRYFLLHLKAIMSNFFNFKKVFFFLWTMGQGRDTIIF